MSSRRRSSYFRYLLVPIFLVTVYCIFYANETEEDALLSEKDTPGLRAKKSSNSDSSSTTPTTSPPTPAPLPPPIEVKSHEEMLETALCEDDGPAEHLYTQDTTQILYQPIQYRFPTRTFHHLHKNEHPLFVTGVLSASQELRHAIRQTWAHHHNDTVVFLVGGNFQDIAEEARYERDLFWVNVTEGFHQVLWKSQAFFAAVSTHIPTAQFMLKTDDDAYVNLEFVQAQLLGNDDEEQEDYHINGQYIGSCVHDRPIEYPDNPHAGSVVVPGRTYYNQEQPHQQEQQLTSTTNPSGTLLYPSYAAGGAYVVSQSLAKCMARTVATTPLLSTLEDVDTGILAQVCGHRCVDNPYVFHQPHPALLSDNNPPDFAAAHYLGHYNNGQSIAENMARLHYQACGSSHVDETACAPSSQQINPSRGNANDDQVVGRSPDSMDDDAVAPADHSDDDDDDDEMR